MTRLQSRLREDPTLGVFELTTEDWSLVESVTVAKIRANKATSLLAWLALRRSLHTLPSGRELASTHPVLPLEGRE